MTQPTNVLLASFPMPAGTRRPALGWGMSLLLHGLAIAWLWHAAAPRPANPDTRPARRIVVWLVPGTTPMPRRPTAPAVALAASIPALPHPAPGPGLRPLPSREAAVPVTLQAPAADTTPSAPLPHDDVAQAADGGTPAFDLSAARASARALVRAESIGAATLPLRQEGTDAHSSARIQERFERARRSDCLKANDSVNLLANVLSLAKDVVANAVDNSGCKW